MQQSDNKYQPTKSEIFCENPSFRCLVTASSNSGKSHLIKTLLTDPSFGLTSMFKISNIMVCCPTTKIDTNWSEIIANLNSRSTKDDQFNENEQIFNKDLEQSIQTIYGKLQEDAMIKKDLKEKPEPTLLILDDCLLEVSFNQASQIGRMIVKMRHYNISLFVLTQYLKSQHPLIRSQYSHFITFSTSNTQEIKKIQEECASTLSKREFNDIYHFCCDQRYSYMLVVLGFPVKWKFFKGKGNDLNQLQV